MSECEREQKGFDTRHAECLPHPAQLWTWMAGFPASTHTRRLVSQSTAYTGKALGRKAAVALGSTGTAAEAGAAEQFVKGLVQYVTVG